MKRWTLLFVALAACSPADPHGSPEAATRAFLSAVQTLERPSSRRTAFALVDEASRVVLEARARTAESLSHRPFTGADMFVPSPGVLTFTPERIEDEDVTVTGDRARVVLRGKRPSEVARLELVREASGWHVVLGLTEERPEPASPVPVVVEE